MSQKNVMMGVPRTSPIGISQNTDLTIFLPKIFKFYDDYIVLQHVDVSI